jgi:hypothetical protein
LGDIKLEDPGYKSQNLEFFWKIRKIWQPRAVAGGREKDARALLFEKKCL